MNLILGSLIVAFIFASQPNLKKEALKTYSTDEFNFYASIIGFIILIFTMIKSKVNFKNFSILKSKLSFFYLLLIPGLTIGYSSTLTNLLKDNNPSSVMPIIRCFEMFFLFLISCFMSKEFKLIKLIGIIFVIIGCYIGK